MLYFQFMQTVAAFIVQAVRIDKNKDGTISGSEIRDFFFAVILPLLTNSSGLRDQAQAFFDKIKTLDFEGFKGALMDIVELQLLPEELKGVEEKVDKIARAVFNLITSVEETITAFKEVFGKNKLIVKIIKKNK